MLELTEKWLTSCIKSPSKWFYSFRSKDIREAGIFTLR